MEYVVKVEAEICDIYEFDGEYEDGLSCAKEEFEDIINAEYRELSCTKGEEGISIRNDARQLRLTFANGGIIVIENSEWGSIFLGRGNE